MPNDIALIRCYQRPEFLYHTLECVRKAWKPQAMAVWGWVDSKDNFWNSEVADMASGQSEVKVWHSDNNVGDSCSLLAALQSALDDGAERIYNIEEDVLIAPDFFRWHQTAHKLGQYPLTIASNYHNDPRVSSDADPTAVFASPHSRAIGCCFSRWFAEMLLAHNTPDYYQSFQTMYDYLNEKFPEWPEAGNLQWDGLMTRLMHRYGLKCLYPLKPRAYHAGFYGANRGVANPFDGLPLQEKIKKVGEVIYSNERLQAVSGNLPDCRAYSLDEVPWTELKLLEA